MNIKFIFRLRFGFVTTTNTYFGFRICFVRGSIFSITTIQPLEFVGVCC